METDIELHIKETVDRVMKKYCNISGRMYYLKLTFEGPVRLFIESCEETGADLLKHLIFGI